MTDELTKTFFDTFGIEPSGKKCTCDVKDFAKCTTYYCTSCEKALKKEYPQISDSILLELICILTRFYGELVLEQCLDVKDLKEQVLNIFVRTSYKDSFKHQVRTLFEEER